MRTNAEFFEPKVVYSHLPARDYSELEAQSIKRETTLEATSYHQWILTGMPEDARWPWYKPPSEQALLEKVGDKNLEHIHQGYKLFTETYKFLQENHNDAFTGSEFSALHSDPNQDLHGRVPTIGTYFTLVQQLASQTRERAKDLGRDLPVILAFTKRVLTEGGFLNSRQFDQRLKRPHFVIVDGLSGILDNKEVAGSYSDDIIVLRDTDTETIVHEVLHQLSGRKRLQITANGSEEEQLADLMSGEIHNDAQVFEQRIGLMLAWPKHRYRWLNEATTAMLERYVMNEWREHDNVKLSNIGHMIPAQFLPKAPQTDDGRDYAEYRRITESLIQCGNDYIEPKVLFRAYFEDDAPGTYPRLAHLKTFFRAVNNAYWPGLLNEIDDLVEQEGTQAAFDRLEKIHETTHIPAY